MSVPGIRVRPVGRAAEQKSIAHLCIVAGARAAGKSTFIQQLADATLSNELASQLPAGIGGWPRFSAVHHAKWLPSLLNGSQPPRANQNYVLHYDLLRFAGFGPTDPPLETIGLARATTIVTLRPSIDQLIAQLVQRHRSRLAPSPHNGDGQAATAIDGRAERDHLVTETVRTVSLYRIEGWIDGLYATWRAAMVHATRGAPMRWLEIEPLPQAGQTGAGWRIRRVEDTPAHA